MAKNHHTPVLPFSIIQDTREKNPWYFNEQQTVGHLDTGDYTVVGYEKTLCIERKATTGELCTNLGSAGDRFFRELERMSKFRYKFIICEFPMSYIDIFPNCSGIPKRRWKRLRMTGKFIKKRLIEWSNFFDIELIFAEDRFAAQASAIQIITDIIEGKDYYNAFEGQTDYEIYGGD